MTHPPDATPSELDGAPPGRGTPRRADAIRFRRGLRSVRERSWELELLLSGAVVIALVQLPSEVDAAFWRLDAQLDRGAGAIGLDAAFPRGARWDRSTYGPVARFWR